MVNSNERLSEDTTSVNFWGAKNETSRMRDIWSYKCWNFKGERQQDWYWVNAI